VFAAGLSFALAACQLVLGLGHDLVVADVGDATGPPLRCASGAAPPGPPDAAVRDDPPAPIVFATFNLDLRATSADGRPVGYDLDGVCTCDPTDDSILGEGGRAPCVSASPKCDEEGGVDNTLGSILVPLVSTFSSPAGDLGGAESCGKQSLIIVLSGYNGAADDPSVNVAVLASFGIWEAHDGGPFEAPDACGPIVAPGPYPAMHDGLDIWSARGRDLDGRMPAHFLKTTGYVTNHQLVLDARFTDDSIDAFAAGYPLTIVSPLVTARLVPRDGSATFDLVDGVIAGRVPSDSAVKAFAFADFGSDGLGCNGPLFLGVRDALCKSVDTITPSSNDFAGDKCNAGSFAIQFTAEPALLGSAHEPPAPDAAACGSVSLACPP
jgi:hypothetical protein